MAVPTYNCPFAAAAQAILSDETKESMSKTRNKEKQKRFSASPTTECGKKAGSFGDPAFPTTSDFRGLDGVSRHVGKRQLFTVNS
jgi:hypothetical protein